MISQLVRTRFESNLMSFIVFVALIVAGSVRYLMTRGIAEGPVSQEALMVAASWLMLSCLAAGLVGLLRQNRERSGRLYAQLPVSPSANRIAYWLHMLLYPALAALLLELFLFVGGTEPPPLLFQVGPAGLLVSSALWLACFSLVTGNVSRVIPEGVRRNIVLYCCVVTLATMLLGMCLILTVVTLLGQDSFARTFPVMAALWLALVALDVYLFSKNDSSLA